MIQSVNGKTTSVKENAHLTETIAENLIKRSQWTDYRVKELQFLIAQLIEHEETERIKISESIHEDLQQTLAAALWQLNSNPAKNSSSEDRKKLELMIRESIRKLRNIANDLNPPVLSQIGLVAGIEWLISDMSKKHGLNLEFQKNIEHGREPEHLKLFVFRAVRELLKFIAENNQNKDALVELFILDGGIVLAAGDRVRSGTETVETEWPCSIKFGLGIEGVRQSALYMGGNLTVETEPGKKNRFVLFLPLSVDACKQNKKVNGKTTRHILYGNK